MINSLIRFYAGKATKAWGLIVIMSIAAALSNGLLLAVVNDTIKAQSDGTLSAPHIYSFIILLFVFLLGGYFSMYKTTESVGYMMHNLRIELSRKFLKSTLHQIEKYDRGEIYAHFTVDIDQLAKTALRLVKTFQATIVLVFCIGYIGWLSGIGVLFLFCGLLMGVAAYLLQYKKARESQTIARDGEAAFFDTLTDELNGLKELKLNRKKSDDLFKFQIGLSEHFRFHYTKAELFFYISFLISQVCLFVILGLAIFMPQDWIVTDTTTHFQLLAALLFAMKPIEEVVDSIGAITRGAVALKKIETLSSDLEQSYEQASLPGMDCSVNETISLKNVRMQYRSDRHDEVFDLGPINLNVKKGDIVFFVGGNGSGKTTLLKILTGLYHADEGEIRVDGRILKREDIARFRQNFSAIFTDFHLFKILFGLDNPDPQITRGYLERFNLDDKTQLDGNCYSTIALSTGQKKRLALTSLLLEDRTFLVFDEFAADQDPEFRSFFYKELLPELKKQGKTILAVTHDDMFFDCCDHLVKLDLGGVTKDEIYKAQRHSPEQ